MDGGADDEDVGILEVKSQLLHFHSGLYKQSLLLVLVFFLLKFKLKFKLVNPSPAVHADVQELTGLI